MRALEFTERETAQDKNVVLFLNSKQKKAKLYIRNVEVLYAIIRFRTLFCLSCTAPSKRLAKLR